MLLGVVSDTHNRVDNIEKIIDIFNLNQVDCVVHTGDITQSKSLQRFSRLNSSLIVVYGNNDLKEIGLKETSLENGFDLNLPPLIRNLEDKKVAIFHEPYGIEEIIKNDPSIDLILHGHTHKYRNEEINGVKIFNPGESAGMLKGKNAVGLVRLKNLEIKRIFF
tara:strand:+ start:381 stop:872 length:492 start_codon:yes stop_codon:yes gene_type:complete